MQVEFITSVVHMKEGVKAGLKNNNENEDSAEGAAALEYLLSAGANSLYVSLPAARCGFFQAQEASSSPSSRFTKQL